MTRQLQLDFPFGHETVEEVPLPEAPLEAVVAQLRFPPAAWIADLESIAPFQRAIYTRYPVLRPEREVNVVITPGGATQGGRPELVWRFTDRDERWQLSLAPAFMALDVRPHHYSSRTEFLERFEEILEALNELVRPVVFERLGIRYVDRIRLESEDWQSELRPLIREQLLAMATVELGTDIDLHRTLCDSEFHFSDAILHGRWGLVPPQTTLDPMHGEPIQYPAWLLDLDMYSPTPGDFDVSAIIKQTRGYAERIYGFFRWAVTADFLRRYGANV